MTISEFAESIIKGTGGFASYAEHEVVPLDGWHPDDWVRVVEWTLRCLANPDCEGSQEVLAAIIERRIRIERKDPRISVVEQEAP